MDRYLLIRVVLTQSPFAQVFDVLLDALPVVWTLKS